MKIKLNLGCGVLIKKGWINVDNYLDEESLKSKKGFYKNAVWEKGGKFVKADIMKLPFPNNYADRIELHQVIEHMLFREIIPTLKEIYRVLKPKGVFIASMPDFDGLAVDWLQMRLRGEFDLQKYIDVAETIYGNQAGGGEIHKCPMTAPFLNLCLVSAGFTKGTLSKYAKGTPTPTIGELAIGSKKTVLRNDLLVCEMTK